MPSNLLILALLAGYCFVHQSHFFRFRAQTLDSYRLLLYCSVSGTVLLVISRAIVCFSKLSPLYWQLRPSWNQVANVPYLGTFSLCLPVAFVFAGLWNRFLDPEQLRRTEVERHGDSLTRLMQQSVQDRLLLSITFGTRKWYVGYVTKAPNLRPNEMYFRLLPLLSGYRDKDTLEPRRTTSYQDIFLIPGVDPNDFIVTLPLAEVKTASLFDLEMYDDYFAREQPAAS